MQSGHPMSAKGWILIGLVLLSPCLLIWGIGFVSGIREEMRTPQEKLANHNSDQLKMLAKHRELFEAVANGDPERTQQLRNSLRMKFGKSGACFRFEWWSEAPGPFSCMNVLFYCPNGERDLDVSPTNQHYLMQIDDHWFAAKENCG